MTPIAWAKLAANVFSNRKIRKAGPYGRDVFFFVLTQNAARDATGAIPVEDLELWYVADQLQFSEEQAREGIARATDAGLITIHESEVVIVGWNSEWGKRSLTEAERKRLQRSKAKSGQCLDDVRTADGPTVAPEDAGLDCPTGEKSKERKETSSVKPDPVADLARAATDEINRISGKRYRPDAENTIKACGKLHKAGISTVDVIAAIDHVGRPWLGTEFEKRIRPATLLQLDRVKDAIDDIEAGNVSGAPRYVLPTDSEVSP